MYRLQGITLQKPVLLFNAEKACIPVFESIQLHC
jgi:hypothetical protein